LRLNPKNVKAFYRSSSACLALDKIPEAEDACSRGLELEPKNTALLALQKKISSRKAFLEKQERERRERAERLALETRTLNEALKKRGIKSRKTKNGKELELPEDAKVTLSDPVDASSTLSLPVMFFYPLHSQTDMIKAFEESDTLNEHLGYMLPLPWDETAEYKTAAEIDCYIETVTGGLVKAGKKLPLGKILSSGKVEIQDGLVRVYVVPAARSAEFIEDFKQKKQRT
jgi:hypothetical protein